MEGKIAKLTATMLGIFLSLLENADTVQFSHTWEKGETDLQTQIDMVQNNSTLSHSRHRRYVVFPEGSTFTVAFCMSVKALTGVDSIFTEGLNWALSYDLPNETFAELKKKAQKISLRRSKRNLYDRIEVLMDSAGFDGRSCVLRTICETAQLIRPRQGVVEEIIRLLFTYPLETAAQEISTERHLDFAKAHSHGLSDQDCYENFPCPVSLLELMLQFGQKKT